MLNPVTWSYGLSLNAKEYKPLVKVITLPNGDVMEEMFYDINLAIDYVRSTYAHSVCYKYITLKRVQSDVSTVEWNNF